MKTNLYCQVNKSMIAWQYSWNEDGKERKGETLKEYEGVWDIGVLDIFLVLIVVKLSWMYTYVKIYLNSYFNCVQFISPK